MLSHTHLRLQGVKELSSKGIDFSNVLIVIVDLLMTLRKLPVP